MDIDTLLKRLIKFNNWYNKLSDNEKSIYINNPEAIPSGDPESTKSKILKILKDYSAAERTNEGKDYIQNNENKVRNVLMETQSNLQNLFPSVYDTQFDPILSNTYLSGIIGTPSTENTPSNNYTLTDEEKEKIDMAWANRNNPLARGPIESAWNQSTDEQKFAAMEYAESKGWDFSEMNLPLPAPLPKNPSPETPSAAEAPAETPTEEAPTEEAPTEEAPTEEAPTEEAPAEAPAETPSPITSEDPAEDRLLKVFDRYMVGEYDPSSAMDRGKMEVLKKSLEQFYQENGKRFEIENANDRQKFQTIINKAYASPEYKNAATIGKSISSQSSTQPSTSSSSGEATSSYQVPASIKFGKDTLPAYVDMGGNRYRPATEADISNSKTQLYIRNPRKGKGEFNKPEYVKVRREGGNLRPQSGMGGAAGSVSNFAGDVGNTVKNFFSGGGKKEETDEEGSPTADRPPAKKQSKEGGTYQRNPEGIESFIR